MFTLNCKGRLLVVDKPLIMGIINLTPDSFYAGSRFQSIDSVITQAEKMLQDGAAILDMGAQSTRPGSKRISADEELSRLLPALESVSKNLPEAVISVDTYYASVAKEAVAAGASMINDISGGTMDEEMIVTAGALQVPYILTHIKGNPDNMQDDPHYDDVTKEVLDYFIVQIAALKKAGIRDIIIDPGFGFGKTIEQNFELLKNLSVFNILNLPVLAGLSRKSSVYKTLGIPVHASLNGTTAINTIALMNGANILRVHDVKEAGECITLFERYRRSG